MLQVRRIISFRTVRDGICLITTFVNVLSNGTKLIVFICLETHIKVVKVSAEDHLE